MSVEHPFQVPNSIDNPIDDSAAVNAIGSLHNLIRSLFVFDRSKVYWAYIMGVVGIVGLCELIGMGLLIGLIVKRKVKMVSWHSPCKKLNLDMVLPTLTSFTTFFLVFSGIWFMLFAIHRFRLNELLYPDELHGTLFWLCVIFLPLWLTLYVQAVEFVQLAICNRQTSSEHSQKKRSVLQSLARIITFFGAIAFPTIVIFSTIVPAYYVQQDYNDYLPDILQYFVDSAMTEEGYEYTNTSFNAFRVLRRYEDEAVTIWKNEATVFSEAQPIFIMWSVYFGVLVLMYALGGATIFLRQESQVKNDNSAQAQPIEEYDTEKIKQDLVKPILNVAPTKTKQPFLHSANTSKHIVVAVGSTTVFIIATFVAVKIVILVETAEISNFICNLLGALSSIALATSLFTITHLSILYANKVQPDSSLNHDNDNFSDAHSQDSDLTLV